MRSRRASLALLVAVLAAGCGGDSGNPDGTRSYVGSAADVVLYLTWNRDGDKLVGTLTQGQLDNDKRTVETSRGSFTGAISGSGVSLDLQQGGEVSTLTGTLDGDTLELEYLRADEGIVKVRLEQAGAGVFNAALATLRGRVEQSKADELSEAAETTEKERVAAHAQAVADDISTLETATTGAPSKKGSSYEADLARLRRDLQMLRDHAQAALRADSLSVCSSAATVQSDLAVLEGHVATLRSKQTTRDERAVEVDEAIEKLREDFVILQTDDPRYLPDDAPTQRTVGRAIQRARRKLRKAGSSRSNIPKAVDAILKEARALDGQTTSRCRSAGA